MPLYQPKPVIIECHQWFKNGDLPLDGVINNINEGAVIGRHPKYYLIEEEPEICVLCQTKLASHGILKSTWDGNTLVCPGSYIELIRDNGPSKKLKGYVIHSRELFEKHFEKVITKKSR